MARLDGFHGLEKIFVRFEFGAARANDVESTGIAVTLDRGGIEFFSFVADQAVRPIGKSKNRAFGIDAFDGIENACNDIVSAGSRAAGENHANADRSRYGGFVSRHKCHGWQFKGVGKRGANFLCVGCRKRCFCRKGFLAQRGGEFGLIGGAGFFKGGWLRHIKN